MSIRFHRGVPLITIFHDPSSPVSKQALKLLSQAAGHNISRLDSSSSPQAAQGAEQYLKDAASAPSAKPLELQLEVQDRSTQPPTSDQLRSILSYLKNDVATKEDSTQSTTVSASAADSSSQDHPAAMGIGGAAGPSGTTRASIKEAQDRAAAAKGKSDESRSLEPHLSTSSSISAPKIKQGPIVVNWDEGVATTSVAGVEAMLKKLQDERAGQAPKNGGGCQVM